MYRKLSQYIGCLLAKLSSTDWVYTVANGDYRI